MNADVLVQWYRSQGHRVIRTPSTWWAEVGPRVFQAIPVHLVIAPSDGEVMEFLRQNAAVAVRYSTPLESTAGMVSYHVVYIGKDYSLDLLPKKARYDVRKGLERFSVEPISMPQYLTEGWELRAETLLRQGRTGAETQAWWAQLCNSAAEQAGFEAWGARDRQNGVLASCLLSFRCDNAILILYQQSRTEYLPQGVNNVLSFAATTDFLKRNEVDTVFYGLHSLDAPESVDAYKWRMRFTPKAVRQRVVLHPWLAGFANPLSHKLLKASLKCRPSSALLAKAEGMLRFCLEGRKPLADQEWPEALAESKSRLLAEQASGTAVTK